MKTSLSVTIITKNEEDRITDCLSSVAGIADEIIVLDSGSDDKTVEICKRYTDKVFEIDWPGYGIQKQRALDKASGDWVLAIDADERLTPELADEIRTVLDSNPEEVAFKTQWAVVVFGKQLNYGQSARYVLRLFRREGARFSEDIVHEKVILPEGKVRKLCHRLLHYSIRDYEHLMYKNSLYAWLGGKKRYEKGVTGGGLWGASVRAILVFIRIYIFRRGFLDGGVGYLMAVMYSQAAFNKYAALWSLRRKSRRVQD
ncbi:MAG: glycosyltransferase family 2 protein [Gammaproteobacteria bacterium]|jgi:(heptosyl)LPS beta-1,4-glucosyltransferase|nr:glycosyltransferase family 2 protein [Gammaproteobacteria bacterium]MCZ6797284.1 glycosyltransferase family 2 protein [Gammaproteobacteria bacterium]MCZ6882152.1 glycosyltransferase family 2 protein [Gammaproteobacteria bacterium]